MNWIYLISCWCVNELVGRSLPYYEASCCNLNKTEPITTSNKKLWTTNKPPNTCQLITRFLPEHHPPNIRWSAVIIQLAVWQKNAAKQRWSLKIRIIPASDWKLFCFSSDSRLIQITANTKRSVITLYRSTATPQQPSSNRFVWCWLKQQQCHVTVATTQQQLNGSPETQPRFYWQIHCWAKSMWTVWLYVGLQRIKELTDRIIFRISKKKT